MFKRLRQYGQLLRAFGMRWVFFRVRYALRVRLGFLRRRAPQRAWEEIPSAFSPDSAAVEAGWLAAFRARAGIFAEIAEEDMATATAEGREILAGDFRLFGWKTARAGRFPDWHASSLDPARRAPAAPHWSALGDFAFGDIKNIWELNRWPWAFALARAWLRTRREDFAARFWELAEDWLAHNPPNSGVNWKCGQEAAFRLFAAVFARCAFEGAAATTPARLAAWRRLVRATGERIAANFDYALSQSNNHGVSECVGLLTAGALAGGTDGARWTARAERVLRAQLAALVYPDGGFSQHSAVYHRVLLHDLLWADAAFRAAGRNPPEWMRAAGARATGFLAALVENDNGAAHLYGANDGANILPLTAAPFADFRPVLRACARVFGASGGAPNAPDDAPDGAKLGAEPGAVDFDRHFPDAGVFVARAGGFSVLLRCPTRFRHRATRDMLHLSVRWRGVPVLLNPGTFSYNPPEGSPFAAGFSSAFTHNTATCEEADQMEKLGRFLHLPWPTGEARALDPAGFEAVSHAYRARFGAIHTRRIRFGGDVASRNSADDSPAFQTPADAFEVEDIFESPRPRRWRLHWLLADGEGTLSPIRSNVAPDDDDTPTATTTPDTARWHDTFTLEIPATPTSAAIHCRIRREIIIATNAVGVDTAVGVSATGATQTAPQSSAVRAAPDGVRGWHSPHYQQAQPAWSLALSLPATTHATVRTRFTFFP